MYGKCDIEQTRSSYELKKTKKKPLQYLFKKFDNTQTAQTFFLSSYIVFSYFCFFSNYIINV